jgi:transcriptional regulator with XRE-family HTH domain
VDLRVLLRNLGRRVAELRRDADLTQEQLASKVGVDLKDLQRIEYGRSNITARTMWRLSRALGVDPIELWRKPTTSPPQRRGRPRGS